MNLLKTLITRDIATRYRASFLGVIWSIITPLFMLAVYTFVFGMIFQARDWAIGSDDQDIESFALVLFSGLIVFNVMADSFCRAPTLLRSNKNYITKIVFPIHLLPIVQLGSALFQATISFTILLLVFSVTKGPPPLTAFLIPIPLIPFLIMIAGITWVIASLGVFIRDLEQIMPPLTSALMFLSAIFYPLSALPDWVRDSLMWVHPAVIPINEVRKVLLFGVMPDWIAISLYSIVSLAVAWMGAMVFKKLSKSFADVL